MNFKKAQVEALIIHNLRTLYLLPVYGRGQGSGVFWACVRRSFFLVQSPGGGLPLAGPVFFMKSRHMVDCQTFHFSSYRHLHVAIVVSIP